MFNPNTSIFAGMSTQELQTALSNAQSALIDLQTGGKPVTVSYGQGDGVKSVTYTRAQLGSLTALIRQLQQQLGIIRHPRHAIQVSF